MKQNLFIYGASLCCSIVFAVGCNAQMVEGSNPPGISTSPISPFMREQLRFSRVRQARDIAQTSIEQRFRDRRIDYPAEEMFVRVFKWERELELWVRPAGSTRFELLHTYPVCALAGVLGPKRVQGDGQVPEGFYSIDLFNPLSSYHLSLRIDYPNRRDRAAVTGSRPLGGDIFIHGGCKSDGCLAITDEAIQELYWLAVTTRGMGQEKIPVHIFPTRLGDGNRLDKVKRVYRGEPDVLQFWETLRTGYDYFERTHQLPAITVDTQGQYTIRG